MSREIPTVESSKIVHRGFFDLRVDRLKKADQETLEYTTLLTKTEAVAIISRTKDNKWILTQEYRHSVGRKVLGIPGGRVEKGEEFIECAKRELLEETGYFSDTLYPMGANFAIPSICDQKIQYFFAPNAEKIKEPNLDPFEFIEILLLTEEELDTHIRNSSDVDSAVLTALYYKKLFSF